MFKKAEGSRSLLKKDSGDILQNSKKALGRNKTESKMKTTLGGINSRAETLTRKK